MKKESYLDLVFLHIFRKFTCINFSNNCVAALTFKDFVIIPVFSIVMISEVTIDFTNFTKEQCIKQLHF